jgi:peptide subunit release factor 1 (eRF1)
MNLNISLNEHDVQKLFKLYNVLEKLIRGRDMDTTIYELNCESCGNEYEISYIEEDDRPIYCPFCGTDVDLSEVEDDGLSNDDWTDDFDFSNEDRL